MRHNINSTLASSSNNNNNNALHQNNSSSLGQAYLVSLLPERQPWIGRVNHSLTMHEGQMYRFGGRLVRNQVDVPGPYYQELETLNPVGCSWNQVLEGTARERNRKILQLRRAQSSSGAAGRRGGGGSRGGSRNKRKRLNRGHQELEFGDGGDDQDRLPPEPNKRGDHTACVLTFNCNNNAQSVQDDDPNENSNNNNNSSSISKLYIFGGRMQMTPLSDMYCFNFSTKEWSAVPYESSSGPGPIFGHCAVASPLTKRIYVTGGWHARSWRTPLWAFETTTNTWLEIPRPPHVQLADVNTLRRCAMACWEGTIYVVGWSLTPIDAQPFISNIPILAYNESRNEWSEVAAIGNPPPAVLCSLSLANSVVMPQLGCWTFLCVGDDGKWRNSSSSSNTNNNNNSNRNNNKSPNRSRSASRSPLKRISSSVSAFSSVSGRSPSVMSNSHNNNSIRRTSSASRKSHQHNHDDTRSRISSSRGGGSNQNNNNSKNNDLLSGIITKGDVSEAQMLGTGILPNVPRRTTNQQFNLAAQQSSAAGAASLLLSSSVRGGGGKSMNNNSRMMMMMMNSNGNNNNTYHPPSLWSFHFATCRWIQHKIFLSQATVASNLPDQFSLPILTNRLNEQNTDPFETKYSLVVTGSDSLVMWGGCLDRDHIAIRLKLSVEQGGGATTNRSLTHQQYQLQQQQQTGSMMRGGGVGGRRTVGRPFSSSAASSSSSPRLSGATSVGLALPLPLHRQMRSSAKRQSHSARMFGSSSSTSSAAAAVASASSKSNNNNNNDKNSSKKNTKKSKKKNRRSSDSDSTASSSSDDDDRKKTKNTNDDHDDDDDVNNHRKQHKKQNNNSKNSTDSLMNEFQKNTEEDKAIMMSTTTNHGGGGGGGIINGRRHGARGGGSHHHNVQNPNMQPIKLASQSLLPVVRLGNTEQIQAWRRNYYNEQLEWLFSTYTKDKKKAATEEAKIQQQMKHNSNNNISSTANRFVAPPSSTSTPRTRVDISSSSSPLTPATAAQRTLHDENKHRKHAPVNIELNQLSNIASSVAWPLYPVRSLPASSSSSSPPPSATTNRQQQQHQMQMQKHILTKLRWMLLKRYVKSGWGKTGLYPHEATMQGWRDGRVIPPQPQRGCWLLN